MMMRRVLLFFCCAVMVAMHALADEKAVTTESTVSYSGSLPVVYINTTSGLDVTDKDTYMDASAYIEALGIEGYKNMGSSDEPEGLKVKGHGNYTFSGFDKKPLRLKFINKVAPLGMSKNRNFIMLAAADDPFGFMQSYIGFEVSRRMKVTYTPAIVPVELVFNGDYRGLYFLIENIRIGKNRVNITEQADNETIAENITGGWLVEIDNYTGSQQIDFKIGSKSTKVTYHSPETLSLAQQTYLQTQFDAIGKALTVEDKSSTEWENYIDMESLARFYVTREVMNDEEGFHGSCFMYKDRGADQKWQFGPLWDFGSSYKANTVSKYIFVNTVFAPYVIDEAWKFPRFQEEVKKVWADFYNEQYSTMGDFIDNYAELITPATVLDYQRWPKYGVSDEMTKAKEFKTLLQSKVDWLLGQWGHEAGVTDVDYTEPDATPVWYSLEGIRLGEGDIDLPQGIYIMIKGTHATKVVK